MHYEYKGWWLAVLIAVDQLGNAVGGGNPDITISARVGYFAANTSRKEFPKKYAYWKTLEWIIDLAFHAIDRARHCYKAATANLHGHYERGNEITQFVLSIIIFMVYPFIAIVLWPLSLVIRPKRNK